MRPIRSGKRIELTARDVELFKLLYRYQYLRSDFLYAFLGGASQTRFTACRAKVIEVPFRCHDSRDSNPNTSRIN